MGEDQSRGQLESRLAPSTPVSEKELLVLFQRQSRQVSKLNGLQLTSQQTHLQASSQVTVTAQPGSLLTVSLLMSKAMPWEGLIKTIKKKHAYLCPWIEMAYFEIFNIPNHSTLLTGPQ